MRCLLLVVSTFAFAMWQAPVVEPGIIRGVVVDAEGRPAANVLVSASPFGGAFAGQVPATLSAADGSFTITNLAVPLTYFISTESKERNVPDRGSILYAEPDYKPVLVDLHPGEPPPSVRLELPAPFGRLNGTIVDAHTGLPIHNFPRITLRLKDNTVGFLSMSGSMSGKPDGSFSFLLPDRPALIEITLPGCKPWSYVDPSTHEPGLMLQSGRTQQQTVALDCDSLLEKTR